MSIYKGKTSWLAVCFGAQFLAHHFGGEVLPSDTREYGRANLAMVNKDSVLAKNIENGSQVWMSHGDKVSKVPASFSTIAQTPSCPPAAMANVEKNFYGVQFHPEFTSRLTTPNPAILAFVKASLAADA